MFLHKIIMNLGLINLGEQVARNVWNTLHQYGIDEEMMKEAAPKGARNAIIGMYRIVLYQSQAKDDDEERNRVSDRIAFFDELLLHSDRAIRVKRSKCALDTLLKV
ncbi:unnamed protein product [Toxocara canis]|uniref:DNA-directed RNA polymerase n=1 Tax=Toxocara canis TaxID=6265 RepID=A0A183U9T0_TOXCA|nr:unnamed protein product [Toxocara canis]